MTMTLAVTHHNDMIVEVCVSNLPPITRDCTGVKEVLMIYDDLETVGISESVSGVGMVLDGCETYKVIHV